MGGAAGVVLAWRAEKRKPGPAVHPAARAYVLRAAWLGVIGTAALIGGTAFWGQATSGWIHDALGAIAATLAVVAIGSLSIRARRCPPIEGGNP